MLVYLLASGWVHHPRLIQKPDKCHELKCVNQEVLEPTALYLNKVRPFCCVIRLWPGMNRALRENLCIPRLNILLKPKRVAVSRESHTLARPSAIQG